MIPALAVTACLTIVAGLDPASCLIFACVFSSRGHRKVKVKTPPIPLPGVILPIAGTHYD